MRIGLNDETPVVEWRLVFGDWQLATGYGQLAVGDWLRVYDKEPATKSQRPTASDQQPMANSQRPFAIQLLRCRLPSASGRMPGRQNRKAHRPPSMHTHTENETLWAPLVWRSGNGRQRLRWKYAVVGVLMVEMVQSVWRLAVSGWRKAKSQLPMTRGSKM